MGKFGYSLDVSGSARKTSEYLSNISTLLHRDDTELVLLVDPDQESLCVIVEDTSTIRPVTV